MQAKEGGNDSSNGGAMLTVHTLANYSPMCRARRKGAGRERRTSKKSHNRLATEKSEATNHQELSEVPGFEEIVCEAIAPAARRRGMERGTQNAEVKPPEPPERDERGRQLHNAAALFTT